MKSTSIISRYVFRETLPPFFIALIFFSFIFMMTNILEITNLIVNYRINLSNILLVLVYSMPFFLGFIIPMSVMLAVLLTFLQMSSDNEIIALKAGGVSLYRLLPPVMLLCLMGFLLTAYMTIVGLPWGKSSFKKTLLDIAASDITVGLKERTFDDSFKDIMFYVNEIDLQNQLLIDVFLEEQREGGVVSTIIAPKGRLIMDREDFSGRLRLYKGIINNVNKDDKTSRIIHFDEYELRLDLKKAITDVRPNTTDEEEMTLSELRRQIQTGKENKDTRYYSILMEYHERFSIPFACFALGLLAIPLGLQPMSGKRSFGLVLGLFFFLLYYIMLLVGWSLGESKIYHPAIGMWLPNIVMGGLGIFLLVRTINEKPVRFDSFFIFLQRTISRLRNGAKSR